MRTNNLNVIKTFLNGGQAESHTTNLRTVGNRLVNYNTTIAQRNDDGELIVNLTKYSSTTSKLQSYLMRAVVDNEIEHTVVKGVRMGAYTLK